MLERNHVTKWPRFTLWLKPRRRPNRVIQQCYELLIDFGISIVCLCLTSAIDPGRLAYFETFLVTNRSRLCFHISAPDLFSMCIFSFWNTVLFLFERCCICKWTFKLFPYSSWIIDLTESLLCARNGSKCLPTDLRQGHCSYKGRRRRPKVAIIYKIYSIQLTTNVRKFKTLDSLIKIKWQYLRFLPA